MNLIASLFLAVIAFSTFGECVAFWFVKGKEFPSTYDCKENVDRTGLERSSLIVNREGRWFRRVDEFVQLPQTGGIFPGTIVCIEVADLSIRGIGGYINRVSGGVGEKSVRLHLTSEVGSGLKFQITAYYQLPEVTTTTKKK